MRDVYECRANIYRISKIINLDNFFWHIIEYQCADIEILKIRKRRSKWNTEKAAENFWIISTFIRCIVQCAAACGDLCAACNTISSTNDPAKKCDAFNGISAGLPVAASKCIFQIQFRLCCRMGILLLLCGRSFWCNELTANSISIYNSLILSHSSIAPIREKEEAASGSRAWSALECVEAWYVLFWSRQFRVFLLFCDFSVGRNFIIHWYISGRLRSGCYELKTDNAESRTARCIWSLEFSFSRSFRLLLEK